MQTALSNVLFFFLYASALNAVKREHAYDKQIIHLWFGDVPNFVVGNLPVLSVVRAVLLHIGKGQMDCLTN